jgi:hypothetical protein
VQAEYGDLLILDAAEGYEHLWRKVSSLAAARPIGPASTPTVDTWFGKPGWWLAVEQMNQFKGHHSRHLSQLQALAA